MPGIWLCNCTSTSPPGSCICSPAQPSPWAVLTCVRPLVQLETADLEPYLANVHDKALLHSLQYGVGFLHETMSAAEQEIVNRLFNNGAIQVRHPKPILLLHISTAVITQEVLAP